MTPRRPIARSSSPARISPRRRWLSGVSMSGTTISPSSPRVPVTRTTRWPSATALAIAPPVPIVSSSGWAWTVIRVGRWRSRCRSSVMVWMLARCAGTLRAGTFGCRRWTPTERRCRSTPPRIGSTPARTQPLVWPDHHRHDRTRGRRLRIVFGRARPRRPSPARPARPVRPARSWTSSRTARTASCPAGSVLDRRPADGHAQRPRRVRRSATSSSSASTTAPAVDRRRGRRRARRAAGSSTPAGRAGDRRASSPHARRTHVAAQDRARTTSAASLHGSPGHATRSRSIRRRKPMVPLTDARIEYSITARRARARVDDVVVAQSRADRLASRPSTTAGDARPAELPPTTTRSAPGLHGGPLRLERRGLRSPADRGWRGATLRA